MKKTIFSTIILLILSITLMGCNQKETKENSPLAIGVLPDLDSIPFIIAEHNNYFEEEGITVTIEQFKSAMDRDSAIQTGNLDGAISDMLAVVFFNDNKFDVKITSQTQGSFKLIAGKESNITDVSQVEGRSIGLSKNTIIEYLTDRIMTTSNVDVASPEKIAIPKIPARLEMLQNNKIDMATLPEPLASLALLNGGNILSSSDELNINAGIMMFTKESIDNKSEEIKALYRAYNKAVDYLNTEKLENYIDVIIEEGGFPKPIAGTLTLPNYTKASMPAEEEFKSALDWLKSKKLTTNDHSFANISDSSLIN